LVAKAQSFSQRLALVADIVTTVASSAALALDSWRTAFGVSQSFLQAGKSVCAPGFQSSPIGLPRTPIGSNRILMVPFGSKGLLSWLLGKSQFFVPV